MASSDQELELLLMEAGKKLLEPPSSTDELVTLLDQVESFLSRVEQSPSESMQNAMSPSVKALIAEQLFRHPDDDVKVAVAACISEITRITAPEAPYHDDQMKEIFQLIVSSLENLSDKSSRSYIKRTSILETVAKVRSCVVMLDLECDALIIEMFQHFLNAIRDYHEDTVFTSMVTIMTLVLEESEDISMELLSPILARVKRDNEEVLPIARMLAKSVLENCASRLKPYLKQAVENSGISFHDYSSVVASICQVIPNAVGQNDAATDKRVDDESKNAEAPLDNAVQEDKEIPKESVLTEQVDLANEKSLTSVVSNGIVQTGENNSLGDSNTLKKQRDDHLVDKSLNTDTSTVAEPDGLEGEKVVTSDSMLEESTKEKGRKSHSKSTEPSDSTHDNEKEVETLTKHKDDSNDDAHPPCVNAEPLGLEGGKVVNSDSKLEESTKEKGRKSHSKSTEPSDSTIVNEKEVETLTAHKDDSKDGAYPPCEDLSVAGVVSTGNKRETDVQPSVTKATEDESDDVASPKPSGTVHDKRSKRAARPKKKDGLTIPSVDDVSKKSSKVRSDSEAKTNKRSGKKVSSAVSIKNSDPADADKTKDESGTESDSDAKPLKDGLSKETIPSVDNVSKKSSKVRSDSEAKTNKRSGKKVSSAVSIKNSDPADADKTKDESGTESDSDAKPLKQLLKKVDSISNNADGTSSRQLEDKKRRARGKVILEKDRTKISTKNDDEEMVGSPKAVKPNKQDTPMDKTPKTNSKRKHTPSKDKASDTLEYDENLVGLKVKVWWPKDHAFYDGVIQSFDSVKKKHKVWYDDGDIEILNLKKEKWEVIKDKSGPDEEDAADHPSPDGSSEIISQMKKAKTADQSSKKARMDSSPKRGGASSGKSKSAASKSGHKRKEDSKVDGSKSVGKSDKVTKAKEHTPKSGSKSVEVASKVGNKSKNEDTSETPKFTKSEDDDNVTPKASTKAKHGTSKTSKSKQENPKVSSNSKGKPLKSGGKSDANGTGKSKSGSSKVKDRETMKENSTVSADVVENAKRKRPSSSKEQGSD